MSVEPKLWSQNYSRCWSQSRMAQVFCKFCGIIFIVYATLSGTSFVRDSPFIVGQKSVDPGATVALLFVIPIFCAATAAAYIISRDLSLHCDASGEPNFNRCAVFYIGVPAFLFMLGCLHRHRRTDDKSTMLLHLSNTLGVVAIMALSILLVPVARHNVLFRLFGWNTAAAVRLHIGAGILVMVAVVGHAGIYLFRWIARGEELSGLLVPPAGCLLKNSFRKDPMASTQTRCSLLEDSSECSCYPLWRNFWGTVSALALLAIGISGLVRRRHYKLFYRVHMLAGPTMLLGAVFHWHRSSIYLAGGAIYYMACGLCIGGGNTECQIRSVDVIRGEGQRPCVALTVAAKTSVVPGQYVKLRLPALSSVAHPFTANTTTAGDLQILFRCNGPFTTSLMEHLICPEPPTLHVDGMYGSSQRLGQVASHDAVLIVAGGIGVTPYLSLLANYNLVCPRVVLHWICRDAALIQYVAAQYLNKRQAKVEVVIHQTGKTKGMDPSVRYVNDLSDLANDDIEKQSEQIVIESIHIDDNLGKNRFAPANISFLPFVTALWLGLGGLWFCHCSYVTEDSVMPRTVGPVWAVLLCWMLRKMPVVDLETREECVKYRSTATESSHLIPPVRKRRQETVVLSCGRPSLRDLVATIKGTEHAGIFTCDPPSMLRELHNEIKRADNGGQMGRISVYEEVFEF